MRQIRTDADVEADKEIQAKANDWERFSQFLDGKDIPRTVDDPTFGKETLSLGGRFNLAVKESNKQAVADERLRCVLCFQEMIDYVTHKLKANCCDGDSCEAEVDKIVCSYIDHTNDAIMSGRHAMQSDEFMKWKKEGDALKDEQARLKQMYATQSRVNFKIVAYDKIRKLVDSTGLPVSLSADEIIRGVVSEIVAEESKV